MWVYYVKATYKVRGDEKHVEFIHPTPPHFTIETREDEILYGEMVVGSMKLRVRNQCKAEFDTLPDVGSENITMISKL